MDVQGEVPLDYDDASEPSANLLSASEPSAVDGSDSQVAELVAPPAAALEDVAGDADGLLRECGDQTEHPALPMASAEEDIEPAGEERADPEADACADACASIDTSNARDSPAMAPQEVQDSVGIFDPDESAREAAAGADAEGRESDGGGPSRTSTLADLPASEFEDAPLPWHILVCLPLLRHLFVFFA